jgi:hypothetical protein
MPSLSADARRRPTTDRHSNRPDAPPASGRYRNAKGERGAMTRSKSVRCRARRAVRRQASASRRANRG